MPASSVAPFASSSFARFIVSPAGRVLRVVAGVAIIVAGLLLVGGTSGYLVAAVGVVPLLAGLTDSCVLGPVFGAPLRGTEVRSQQREPR